MTTDFKNKLFFIILIFLFLIFFPFKKAYSVFCPPEFWFKDNLVVVKLLRIESYCHNDFLDNYIIRMEFKKVNDVFGKSKDSFVVFGDRFLAPEHDSNKVKECRSGIEKLDEIKIQKIPFDPLIKIKAGKFYLLSYRLNEKGEYVIGGCGGIIEELSFPEDFLVLSTKFKIIFSNFLFSGFALVDLLDKKFGLIKDYNFLTRLLIAIYYLLYVALFFFLFKNIVKLLIKFNFKGKLKNWVKK